MFKIYGRKTPICPNCIQAETLLKSKGVDFEYLDVTKDADAMAVLKSKGLTQLPLVVTDEGQDIINLNDLRALVNGRN